MSNAAQSELKTGLFINNEWTASASGKTFEVINPATEEIIAEVSEGDAADIARAAQAARDCFDSAEWQGLAPRRRGMMLAKTADLLKSRINDFAQVESMQNGKTFFEAKLELSVTVDTLRYYAGWADKIHHVLGTVNPVAGPYFNFTMPEPTGVVGVVASEEPALLGLVSRLAPIIVSGNTAVVVVDAEAGLAAVTLAEVLATSDLPGGVVNLLTGDKQELLPWMLGHLDINSVDLTGASSGIDHEVLEESAVNVKRTVWGDPVDESPYIIADFLEMKTVWHPIGR